MKALVVYESMFGNTQAVARAVAQGLRRRLDDVVDAEAGITPASMLADADLLVAGGPTHAFGLSRGSTRKSAREQAGSSLVSRGIGLREWLDALPPGDIAAATFDTRVRHPRVPGSAAKAAARRLAGLGFRIVAPAETFWVGGTPGPLLDGELDRAQRWGERLGETLLRDRPLARRARER